jgi:hypothetical protein
MEDAGGKIKQALAGPDGEFDPKRLPEEAREEIAAFLATRSKPLN